MIFVLGFFRNLIMDRQQNIVRTLNLLQWNAQSLRPKLKEFELLLIQEKIHIAFISETWLEAESAFHVNSYNIVRHDRIDCYGGVAIVVHKSIIAQECHINTQNNGIEILSLKLLNCSDLKNLVSVYCPSSVRTNISDWEIIFSAFKSNSIIAGDFNAHHSSWSNRTDSRGTQIYDAALDAGFTPLNNGEHTRIKLVNNCLQKSSPDITFASSNIAIKLDWRVINENLGSDHLCINMRFNYQDELIFSKNRNIKRANWKTFKEFIQNNFQNLEDEKDLQVLYDYLLDLIYKAANVSIPMIKVPKNPSAKFIPKSYWSPFLSHKVAQRRLALREFRKNPTPENLKLLEEKQLEAKTAIKIASTQDWHAFCDRIDGSTTSSNMWVRMRWMKGLKTTRLSVSEERKFHLLCELAPDFVVPSIPLMVSSNTKLDGMFSSAEMNNCLKKKDTAPGSDEITYSMIWNLPNCAKSFILRIYNIIYATGKIPKQWLDIKVIAIPKLTQPGLQTKLRPISLMSCLCKIFHIMIAKRLEWFVENSNIFSRYTSGFRRGQSTIDCLARLVTKIQIGFSKNIPTLACYLHIENAYNNILVDKLVNILDHLKVGKNICLYIWNFLTDRHIQIKNELPNSPILVRYARKGLAQGDPLSPLLFNIATHQLCQAVNVSICQYADDFVLYSTHKNILESTNNIQQALDTFVMFLDGLGLKLSDTKSKYCIYSRGHRNLVVNLKINEKNIDYVSSYKYLGLWLDKSLRWHKHIKETIEKVQRLQNLLRNMASSSWGLHPKHLRRIYIAMIRSRLDYGSIFFDSSAKTHVYKLEKIQNQSMRIIGGFIKSTPIHVMESELSLPPLHLRRRYLAYKYNLKSASCKNNVTNLLIDELKDLCNNRYWTNKKKPLLVTTRTDILVSADDIASSFPLEMFQLNSWVNDIDLTSIISIHLSSLKESKRSYDPTYLKFNVMEEISDRYHEWYTVYTDGSKNVKDGNGAAFYDPLVANYSYNCFKVTTNVSIMSLELIAISEALDYVKNIPCKNILICTDSKSALQHIARCTSGRRGFSIAYVILSKILDFINNKKELRLQWVPSHIGLKGNEEADRLAKEATLKGKLIYIKPDFTEFLPDYKRKCQDLWGEYFNIKSVDKGIWYRTIQSQPLNIPWFLNVRIRRRLIVIAHRLRSGHMPLNGFRYLMNISDSPLCDACGIIEDVHHLLTECVRFQSGRDVLFKLMNSSRLDMGMFINILAHPESKDSITLFEFISLIS